MGVVKNWVLSSFFAAESLHFQKKHDVVVCGDEKNLLLKNWQVLSMAVFQDTAFLFGILTNAQLLCMVGLRKDTAFFNEYRPSSFWEKRKSDVYKDSLFSGKDGPSNKEDEPCWDYASMSA